MTVSTLPRPVRRVGLVAKSHLRAAVPHLAELAAWLTAHGIEPVFETATAALVGRDAGDAVFDRDGLVSQVDLIVVLGGDGTLLGMADRIAQTRAGIPVIGVNFGGLGFLTEITLQEIIPALEATLAGRAPVDRRMVLRARTWRAGTLLADQMVLNDVVIAKGARSRIIDLSITVDDEFLTRVLADGLIVATPTGSTAYNLASGGPIVHPRVDALTITPIAPHTLTQRPLVVDGAAHIRVRPNIGGNRDEVEVTFDGQSGFALAEGDEVEICRGDEPLLLVRSPTRGYFDILRQKLKWGER